MNGTWNMLNHFLKAVHSMDDKETTLSPPTSSSSSSSTQPQHNHSYDKIFLHTSMDQGDFIVRSFHQHSMSSTNNDNHNIGTTTQ
jgi:hypothetical protein